MNNAVDIYGKYNDLNIISSAHVEQCILKFQKYSMIISINIENLQATDLFII